MDDGCEFGNADRDLNATPAERTSLGRADLEVRLRILLLIPKRFHVGDIVVGFGRTQFRQTLYGSTALLVLAAHGGPCFIPPGVGANECVGVEKT